MSAGKGDRPRPVKKDVYDQNYDRINWSRKGESRTGDAKQPFAAKQAPPATK